jgi:GTP-binding protein
VSGASGRDPVEDFDVISRELKLYSPAMLDKPQLVAANKIDAVDDPARVTALEKRARKLKLAFFRISAVTGEGVKELLEAAWPIIARARELEAREIELAREEDDDAPPPADYNPALVAPLRGGPQKRSRPTKAEKASRRR